MVDILQRSHAVQVHLNTIYITFMCHLYIAYISILYRLYIIYHFGSLLNKHIKSQHT